MSLRSRTAALPGMLALSPVVCTSARPILKRAGRPSPLPLSPSPFPFSASFSAMLSVSARSPHVHFPPSPLLQSVISIQSPLSSSSFVRGSLPPVSPNTVQAEAQEAVIPSSFSFAAFKLADAPKPTHNNKDKKVEEKPAAVHFEDPRSPRPTSVMALGAAALKLASKPRTELYNALTTYPRSPYPSAPAPAQEDASEEAGSSFQANDLNADQRGPPKRRNSESAVPTPPPQARSLGARNTNHHSVTSKPTATTSLSLSRSRSRSRSLSRRPPPQLNLFSPSSARFTVQQAKPALSPVQELSTDDDGGGHRPSYETSPASVLNNAFWESVSIDLEGLPLSGSDGSSFPESVSSGASLDTGKAVIMEPIYTPQLPRVTRMSQMSPMPQMQPELLFADGNGNLWSPALPRQQQPYVGQGSDVGGVRRSTLTAPSPKDPRSKFPSFSAAFGVVQMIRTPVRAHML